MGVKPEGSVRLSDRPRWTKLFHQALCIVVSCTLVSAIPLAPQAYGEEGEDIQINVSSQSVNEPEQKKTVLQEETTEKNIEEQPSASADVRSDSEQKATQGSAQKPEGVTDASNPIHLAGATSSPLSAASELDLQELTASILKNCSATIEHEGTFAPSDTGTHVKVALSDQVSSCYLTLFAYASNTSFDPDSTANIRLWSGRVTDGFDSDVDFSSANLPLKKGYSVIACLNVPITEDYYRPCNSVPVRITDENGEGFTDYTYPDAFISDEELEAGATSLHVSLTGDERLFEAARNGQTKLTVSLAQYPADNEFDFESQDQIQLCSPMDATEAFEGKEVQLSEPLRAGYRVRAVVYWTQNPDIFLVKGNDYEASFHRLDDSLVVSEDKTPTAAIEGELNTASSFIKVNLGGQLPEGSMLLVKSFAEGEQIATDKGTPLGMSFNVAGNKSVEITPNKALSEGERIVAFVLNAGSPIAQSEEVSVKRFTPVDLSLVSALNTETREVELNVRFNDPALANEKINAVQLRSVGEDGKPNTDASGIIAGAYMQDQGDITLQLAEDTSFSAGQQVCIRVMNYANDIDFFSEVFTVADMSKDEIVLQGESVAADATSLDVVVSGYAAFEGGRLILTQGSASENDADSRTQLGSVMYTGAGTYSISIPEGKLQQGKTVLAHLYKYDYETDATQYAYGNQLPVVGNAAAVEPVVDIVTAPITADRTDFWAIVNFDSEKVGRLTVYSYTGESWTEDDVIYSGTISPQENSQRITFDSDKLIAGGKVVAVLSLYGGGQALQYTSTPKPVAAAPEKQKPFAKITSEKVTAGMTTLNATMSFDSSDTATYQLYRFTDEELDTQQATLIASGPLYSSTFDRSIYFGPGKIEQGDKLQLVLTAGSLEARSNVMEVQPSPDWGKPYIAFGTSAVQSDAKSVFLTVDYSDEYLSLGDDFYCDVTLYQVSSRYSDEEIEEKELWEDPSVARRVGQINSNYGQETRGELKIDLYDWINLEPGTRLFAKLRLPHSEWAGEEVDYVAASVSVLEEGEELPQVKVLLYNLGEDTTRGAHIRSILSALGVAVESISAADLDQTIGYLAGLSGFEAGEGSGGESAEAPSTEFMLMCGFSESLLDRFLDTMQAENIRIDHKAIVTEYNRYYTLSQLIGDIQEEHEVFQALLALDKTIAAAEALDETVYGKHEAWADLQQAIEEAHAVLSSDEPALETLMGARQKLIDLGNKITDGQFWKDEAEPNPGEEENPGDQGDQADPSSPEDNTGQENPAPGNAGTTEGVDNTGKTPSTANKNPGDASPVKASGSAVVDRGNGVFDVTSVEQLTQSEAANNNEFIADEQEDLIEDEVVPLSEGEQEDIPVGWALVLAGLLLVLAAIIIFVKRRARLMK